MSAASCERMPGGRVRAGLVVAWAALLFLPAPWASAVDPKERAALIALYNSTNGPSWTWNDGWRDAKEGTECSWQWAGVKCNWDGPGSHVTKLTLPSNNLTGTLPPELGDLTSLDTLDLGGNHLTGPIPSTLGNLPMLNYLYLGGNELTGTIPSTLGNDTLLMTLSLSSNLLTGSIPSSLGNLSYLSSLHLGYNQLSGTIPASLGNCRWLSWLSLYSNQLTGPIPPELGNLARLEVLQAFSNQLTGPLPATLGNLAAVRAIYLEDNQLTGPLPSSLGNLKKLELFYVWNNHLTGPIPEELGNATSLKSLYVYDNQLTGPIPAGLGNLANLEYLYLHNNQLTGPIPSSIGNLTKLNQLYLYNNQLSGDVPASLGNLASIEWLGLENNRLTGSLPASLGNLTTLVDGRFAGNQLSGEIPPELANLTDVDWIDLRWNALHATDPALMAFLDDKSWMWRETQTVAPENLGAPAVSATSITLDWTPIPYAADGGGYHLLHATAPGGPYTLFGTTDSKSVSSLTLTGLAPATTYYFVAETETPPHANNENLVRSERTAEVAAATTPPEAVSLASAAFTVAEARPVATITVVRAGGATDGMLVDYSTSDGTAIAGQDYTATSGTLTFAAGQMTATIPVLIRDDTLDESGEAFYLVLANARAGAAVGEPSTAAVTIADDDVGGKVQFSAATYSVTETGPAATITVTRTGGAAGDVTVQYATADGTAKAGVDYQETLGAVSFAPGQSSTTFTVPVIDDTVAQGNLTALLSLSNPTGGATLGTLTSATLTIVENERVVQFGAPTFTVSEAGPVATVTVKRTVTLTGTVSVDYVTSDGTAKAGVDYQAQAGTLTFGPNVVSKTFTIPILNDTLDENDETILVRLRSAADGAVGALDSAVVTIKDNDAAATVQFSAPTYSVREMAGQATITVTRSGNLPAPVTVAYAATSGTAIPGDDFTEVAGTLTFAPNQTMAAFSVPILNDALGDGDETVSLTLSSPGGATLRTPTSAVLTIVDDEYAIWLSSPSYSVTEGAAAAVVVRRNRSTGSATVHYSTADGTAHGGPATDSSRDYTTAAGTLTFGPNVLTKTIAIPTTNDTVNEPATAFSVTLDTPTGGAALGRQSGAMVTINDNDAPGVVHFAAAAYSVAEGKASVTITVTRTDGTASGVVVACDVTGGTAREGADFSVTGRMLTFTAGAASRTFTISITNDPTPEDAETIVLTLTPVAGGPIIGPRGTTTVTITDNDAPQFAFSAAAYTVSEAASQATITVKRTGVLSQPGSVRYATSNGTAIAGQDYTETTGTLSFPAGAAAKTFTVPITNDTVDEADETLTLTLTSAISGHQLGSPSTAVLTITDNDVAGTVQFGAPVVSEVEPADGETSLAMVTVMRTGGTSSEATVQYATSDGTASSGSDYTETTGTLTFAAGQTSATFTVELLGDAEEEGNEAIDLTLSNPGGRLALGAQAKAKLWIVEPAGAAKLIFIHHSTGENWLADKNGQLAKALRDNNYFVSDTNYTWGPDYGDGTTIGDHTDIGNWWDWFRGESSDTYLAALYNEFGQNTAVPYTRLADPDPERENEIVVFKSCFPNSYLSGNPDDPATTEPNPLRGADASSADMTVANAKGIYNDLLVYFAAHPEKLFVLVTAPPLVVGETSPEAAANARALNHWLVNDWLTGYAQHNVAVFDFFNVLTTNGGTAAVNDLAKETGNHHRWWLGAVQHKHDVATDVSAYATSASDSHPTAAGGKKATGEFVTLLNFYYNQWKGLPILAEASVKGVRGTRATRPLGPDAIAPPGRR